MGATRKPRGGTEGDAGARLDARAKKAEDEWKRKHPEAASVPAAEVGTRAAARRAELEHARAHGDEKTRERADARLAREREKVADRERFRPARRRPHKHRPGWLTDVPIVTEATEREGQPCEMMRPARDGEKATRTGVVVGWDVEPPPRFARVSKELAQQAQALRSLLDVVPRATDGTFPRPDGRDMVAMEVAEAVAAARKALASAWVSTLVDLLWHAVAERRRRALNRGAPIPGWRRRGEPVEAGAILDDLQGQTQRNFRGLVAVPEYVTEGVVAWALERVTLGHGGGAKRGKLSPDKLRALLLDARKLARAVGQTRGR